MEPCFSYLQAAWRWLLIFLSPLLWNVFSRHCYGTSHCEFYSMEFPTAITASTFWKSCHAVCRPLNAILWCISQCQCHAYSLGLRRKKRKATKKDLPPSLFCHTATFQVSQPDNTARYCTTLKGTASTRSIIAIATGMEHKDTHGRFSVD